MLNSVIFVNNLSNELSDSLIYHGTSHKFFKEALNEGKWFFGRASNYAEDGEGNIYDGETDAINEFFHLDTKGNTQDVVTAMHIHSSIERAPFDTYNTCWSINPDVAKKYAYGYDDGVVISLKLSAFVAAMENTVREWSTKASAEQEQSIETLLSGCYEDANNVGWGSISASAAMITYLPNGYSHLTAQTSSSNWEFMHSLTRNMRLPTEINGKVLSEEKEVRFTFDLSNSDGAYYRSGNGPGLLLEPMIKEGSAVGGKPGIWVYGLKINELTGYTLISVDLL